LATATPDTHLKPWNVPEFFDFLSNSQGRPAVAHLVVVALLLVSGIDFT
jgi:hypothetical protein